MILAAFGMPPLAVLLTAAALGWLVISLRLWRTWIRILPLTASAGEVPERSAVLSVIIPFRDEATELEDTVHRLLRFESAAVEILLVDDGSSDGSAEAADRLAADHARVRVLHLSMLPTGWLGKPHACWRGAAEARGEYLLFMDADVKTGTTLLPAVLAHLDADRPAHLVVLPRSLTEGIAERALMALFLLVFTIRFNPAGAMRADSRQYFGVGAFNLLRRDVYEAIGGYAALAGEVADDVMLGRLVKSRGYTSTVLDGSSMCAVRWRRGFRDTLKGIRRSVFPGMQYRWRWVALAAAGILTGMLLPFGALFVPDPSVRISAAVTVLCIQFAFAIQSQRTGSMAAAGLFLPWTASALLWTIVRSAVETTLGGTISWRGREYRKENLRR